MAAKISREIDKELMYSKIMPTAYKAAQQARFAEQAASGLIAAPLVTDKPTLVAEEKAPKLFQENGVQLKEREPYILINVMEKIVADKLDLAFQKFKSCQCDRCRQDVAAIALNRLPPKYVVARSDALYDIMERQTSVEVTAAIVKAILIVRANPRH